jgi:Cft2 family RNA processing exonuclease
MFKQAFNVFKRTETVPLIKYVEAHTALVETQFKFYNAVIVLGGSFIVWSIDRERTHVDKRFEQVDKRFEQVDKRLETIESDLKEIKNLFLVATKK